MALYVGTNKVNPSGIGKVYVGTNLVYEKHVAQWHTIFEGSKTVSTQSGTTQSLNICNYDSSAENLTFRLTYGVQGSSAIYSDSGVFIVNSLEHDLTSTLTNYVDELTVTNIEQNILTAKNLYIGYSSVDGSFVYLKTIPTTNTLNLYNFYRIADSSHWVKITITKIEQYY